MVRAGVDLRGWVCDSGFRWLRGRNSGSSVCYSAVIVTARAAPQQKAPGHDNAPEKEQVIRR